MKTSKHFTPTYKYGIIEEAGSLKEKSFIAVLNLYHFLQGRFDIQIRILGDLDLVLREHV
jgi:hypothetical protein